MYGKMSQRRRDHAAFMTQGARILYAVSFWNKKRYAILVIV